MASLTKLKIPDVRWFTGVLWFFAFSFTLFSIQSGDVFMYLALARDIVLSGRWETADPYLYAPAGAQLVWQHEYLSYLLFHTAHGLAGEPGLILLKSLLLGVLFALVLKAAPLEMNRSLLFVGLWCLAVIAASFRFIERSSLLSDLFCVLLVRWLFESYRIDRRLLLRLSALFFVWIQVHPGFPLGLGLLGLWCMWNLIYNPQFIAKDLLWLALPCAVLLINPLGLQGVLYPFQFALKEAQTLKMHNFEWFASYHPSFRFAPEVMAFWILSVLTFSLIAREHAWSSLRTWMAAAAFLLGMGAVRFIPWASFVMLLSIKPWSDFRRLHTPALASILLLFALVSVAVKNLSFGYESSSGPRRPQWSIDAGYFPLQTLEVLRQKPIPGRVYNTHDFGAYMVWQNFRPVFHHGFVTDMDFYKNEVIGVFESQRRFLELAAKYNWTMLLVEKKNSYAYFWKILSPLPEWKIVAEDEGSYLIYRLP